MSDVIDFIIKFGYEQMDFVAVTELLTQAYWSEGISQAEVEQGARNSTLVLGAFTLGGRQIGYARTVSDKTRFAYVMDVYVNESRRGQGVGRKLINSILEHPELKDVYQWLIKTKDAHTLYHEFGFGALEYPSCWLEIRKPRPVRR